MFSDPDSLVNTYPKDIKMTWYFNFEYNNLSTSSAAELLDAKLYSRWYFMQSARLEINWDNNSFSGRGNRKRKESAAQEETPTSKKKSENVSDGTRNIFHSTINT